MGKKGAGATAETPPSKILREKNVPTPSSTPSKKMTKLTVKANGSTPKTPTRQSTRSTRNKVSCAEPPEMEEELSYAEKYLSPTTTREGESRSSRSGGNRRRRARSPSSAAQSSGPRKGQKTCHPQTPSSASSSDDFENQSNRRRSARIQETPKAKDDVRDQVVKRKGLRAKLLMDSHKPGPSKKNTTPKVKVTPKSKVQVELATPKPVEMPPCPFLARETQFTSIWQFLYDNIQTKSSRCTYVSGVPGTGKTKIVTYIADELASNPQIDVKFLYVNGLRLLDPNRIWVKIFQAINGPSAKATPPKALAKLITYFGSKSKRTPFILVVDELDQILTKRQNILYNLLEWSNDPTAMFSFVAIFNTMNLPETVLHQRNASRMGFCRIAFPPYTAVELEKIVINDLEKSQNKLTPDAIVLLSKKVAAISGDARRALEISRRAVEFAQNSVIQSMSCVQAVNASFKEIFSTPIIDMIRDCSRLEQTVLSTIGKELTSTGLEAVTMYNVVANVQLIAPFEGTQWTMQTIMLATEHLQRKNLIVFEKTECTLTNQVTLNVAQEDVNFALSEPSR